MRIKEWYFVILTFICYVLQLLTSQSRTEAFVILFVFILLAYVSNVYDIKNYRKIVRPMLLFAIVGVGAVFLSVTLLRANLSSDGIDISLLDELILQPFSTYFYVPILAFDYTKETLLNPGFPFMGCATFSAIVDTLLLPLTYIDHSFGSLSMNTILGNTIGDGMYFPSGKHWMAMFTGCANYYLDFWYFGFIVFPILHGWVLAKLVYTFKRNAASFIILAFMFYTSFRHATASGIQSIDTVFFFFWVYLTIKSKAVCYSRNSATQKVI
jgi:oligosaccharide repeat unit polymerase